MTPPRLIEIRNALTVLQMQIDGAIADADRMIWANEGATLPAALDILQKKIRKAVEESITHIYKIGGLSA